MRKKLFYSLILMTFAVLLFVEPMYAGDYVITEDLTGDLYELNENGMPYWYPLDVKGFENYHADEKDYVRDLADIYSPEEEALIEEKVKELREKHNADFVVYTDISNYGLEQRVYGADYFVFNGFGAGDTYSGMILYICMDPDDRGWIEAGTGELEYYFKSDKNVNKLDDTIYDYLCEGDYAVGTLEFFDELDGMIGKPIPEDEPMGMDDYILMFLFALIPGVVVASVVLAALLYGMKSVAAATSAREYLVPGSFVLSKEKDRFVNITVQRVYNPPAESDSSGGSSSFSSSSGSSFSGGGGKF